MTDPTLIAASALTALNHVKTLVADALGLRVDREVREKLGAIESALSATEDKLLALKERHVALTEHNQSLVEANQQLKAEVARLKAWDGERDSYELKDVGSGAYAYVAQGASETDQSTPYLCQRCYENTQKRVLQPVKRSPFGVLYRCPECGTKITVVGQNAPASLRQAPR